MSFILLGQFRIPGGHVDVIPLFEHDGLAQHYFDVCQAEFRVIYSSLSRVNIVPVYTMIMYGVLLFDNPTKPYLISAKIVVREILDSRNTLKCFFGNKLFENFKFRVRALESMKNREAMYAG